MSEETSTPHKPRLRFDPSFNAGHIMQLLGMMAVVLIGWANLDKRVLVLEENRTAQRQVDMHQNEMQRAEMAQLKETLSEIKRSVERVNDQLTLRPQALPIPPRQQIYPQEQRI